MDRSPRAHHVPANAQPERVPGLTVAVLHYQTPDVLETCLERVVRAAPGARVLLVDAGDARPLPPAWLDSLPPEIAAPVERIEVSNHSYAATVNAALRAARTPLVAFLNADVFVRPETFANLAYALREPRVAAVGPLVRDAAGRLQRQGVPYRRYQRRVAGGALAVDVPWLSGCCQMVRLEAIVGALGAYGGDARAPTVGGAGDGPRWATHRHGPQATAGASANPTRPAVGGLDPTFRFYNEDIEWGWRMRRAGWSCRLVATPVVHLGGSATPPGRDAFLVEGLRGGYVLSRRTQPKGYRALHRRAVMLWAALMERFGPSETKRAYRTVRRMLVTGRVDESPFGSTLADEAPGYWNRWSGGERTA